MTDPNTPTTPTSNPQDLIDQALGGTPAPTVIPDPTPAVTEPNLPTPEPLTPPVAVVEAPPMSTEPVLPPAETVPTELTSTPVTPMMEEPPVDTKPMGEDMPLAFAGMTADTPADTKINNVTAPIIEPVNNVVPPILTAPATDNTVPKKKSKSKLLAVVAGFFLLFASIGTIAYNTYGDPITIAGVTIGKNGRPSEIDDPGDCSGESNGGWLVWRNGGCKVTGISGSDDKDGDGVGDKDTTNPNLANLETKGEIACKNTPGAQWCSNFGFCMKNDGSEGNCNNRAVQLGYTVQIGNVSCVKENGVWKPDGSYRQGENLNSDGTAINDSSIGAVPTTDAKDKEIYGDVMSVYDQVDKQCKAQSGVFTAAGKESYICREGVAGIGGVVYSGGACTELNGKKFTGTLGCFCGTVQVDTTNGHTSYSSTCGCDKDNPEPSTPTITTNPTLMCSSLTRTPTTTPAVGDKVAFTCVGASTPAGAVSLTYKFRYSLNSGAYVAMTNKTTTTSELTIASCGSYKVQCQACGTINGVLTCDPVWGSATVQ